MNLKNLLLAGVVLLAIAPSCKREANYYMTLSTKEIDVESSGATVSFDVDANVYYRVNNDCDFAKIIDETQNGNISTFTLRVNENPNTEPRAEYIRFIGDHVTPLRLLVSQARFVTYGVSPETIDVTAFDTKTKFTVLGDKAWTATCDNPEFELSSKMGVGEEEVVVTFPANDKPTPKTAVVTVNTNGNDYKVTITQGALIKEYKDLSAGGTANCYIVTEKGYYKFKATVRGNGYLPASCNGEIETAINPASVGILWTSYNTKVAPATIDDIITELAVKDGYVTFATGKADFQSGNVVIAAYDAAGTIIWSWHIWVTEEPSASKIGSAYWMDRNLGAVCANVKGDARSIGLLYQWGRKDPLRSASSFDDGDFIATFPAFTDPMTEVAVNETTGTIAASIANPVPFINTFPGGSGPKDWIFLKDHNDRWMDDTKTMFDPCPPGYKVPSTSQMEALGSAGGIDPGSQKYSANPTAKAAYNTTDHVFETAAWSFPIAGYIAYNDGTKLTDVNVCVKVVTSSRASAPSSYYLNGNASAVNFSNSATCGHAAQVRCVKE